MKKWLGLALGIATATGGFLDAGTVATSGEAGAKFGLGLIWAILVATVAVVLLVEMSGRFAAVSKKTYADAIREEFGFKFYLLPLLSELIAEGLLLAAEIGGIAIALSLITGLSWHYLFPVAALLVWVIIWRAPFSLIENGPALLGLLILSFVVAIVVLGGPPKEVLPTLWKPEIKSGELADYLYLVAATLGSTISPYLLHFYSSGAREEEMDRKIAAAQPCDSNCWHGFRQPGFNRPGSPCGYCTATAQYRFRARSVSLGLRWRSRSGKSERICSPRHCLRLVWEPLL